MRNNPTTTSLIITLIAQLCGIAATILFVLGESYITDGYGLHPVLAGAMAAAILAFPYMTILWDGVTTRGRYR